MPNGHSTIGITLDAARGKLHFHISHYRDREKIEGYYDYPLSDKDLAAYTKLIHDESTKGVDTFFNFFIKTKEVE